MRYLGMRLRARLLWLVLVPVVPALGLALHTHLGQRQLGAARVESDALRVVQLGGANQMALIEAARRHLGALARLPEARSTNVRAFDSFFASMPRLYSDFTDFGLIETNGDLVSCAYAEMRPANLAHRADVQRVLSTKDFSIGGYAPEEGRRKASLFFGHPVFNEQGGLARILYVALDLAVLNTVAAKARLPEGGIFTVFDRDGYILARHPEPEKWIGKLYADSSVAGTALVQREGAIERRGDDGVARLYAFTSVPSGEAANLFLSVGIPTTLAFAEINRVLWRNLLILGLVALAAMAAALAYANSQVIRPIGALARAARRVAAGDLGARTGLTRGSGELLELARAFDDMSESLQQQRNEAEHAARALRQSEERFRIVVEAAPNAMIMVSDDGRIAMVNGQVERLFGYAREELLGQVVEVLVPERFRDAHPRLRQGFFHSPRARTMGAAQGLFGLRKDGSEVPIELGLNPITTTEGRFILASLIDITERKKAEERLRQFNAELEERVNERTAELFRSAQQIRASLQEKEALLQEVHHRVKNNLQVIASLLSLQSGHIDDPRVSVQFLESQRRIYSMALIHEKLCRSKNFATIDFAQHLRDLTAMLAQSYSAVRGVTVDVQADPIVLDMDTAVPLGLIVNELVSNSFKHGFPSGRTGAIAIQFSQRGDEEIQLNVSDDGVGLPQGFEWRSCPSLGMKVVTSLARQLRATVNISNGTGTHVSVTMPAPSLRKTP